MPPPRLSLQSPEQLLLKLGALAEQGGGVMPRLRLDMASGHSYTGAIRRCDGFSPRPLLMFALQDGAQDANVCYLYLDEVRQVTVLDVPAHARLLRFGETERWGTDEPPGPATLRRRVDQFAALYKNELSLRLDLDESLMNAPAPGSALVCDLLAGLRDTIVTIKNDEAGRQALAGIDAVSVLYSVGKPLSAVKSGRLLAVSLDPEEGLGPREGLTRMIETAL